MFLGFSLLNINQKSKSKFEKKKGFEKLEFVKKIPNTQRKERDSNPRYEKVVQRISNPTL